MCEDEKIILLHFPHKINTNFSFYQISEQKSQKKEDYIEVGEGKLKEAYRVTGYDIHSTPGVEYVTLNPMYIKDQTPAPEVKPGDNGEDYFWLNGGEI